ncbi:hypothetical protein JW978_00495 [Candidatus Dojkabacteria bacterium]|nr:hypothetical protein [Candidatus Dojkabacteria bacterium]
MPVRGKFIVFEGLNGCGKGVAVNYAKEYFNKNEVYDLRDHMRKYNNLPEASDLKKYKVILSAEPTHSWVGAAIRQEMFYDNGRDYTGENMLSAYSLDRLILYKRVLVPFRELGGIVIQERTISTTLIQQPVQEHKPVDIDTIINHPNHEYILKNLPDEIIIYRVDPKKVGEWLFVREEQENDIFEKLKMQKKFQKRWESTWFKEFFEKRGTKISYIDNFGSLNEFEQTVEELYKNLFPK